MITLAWKNLLHDKVRLLVTLVGIVFALVLILVQFGLFLGFMDTTANIVAMSGADLWVTAPGIPHVNGGSYFPDSRRTLALSVPGVRRAEKYMVQFVRWKLPGGSQESVQIVGFTPGAGMGGPWNVVAGSTTALEGEDTIMVDEIYLKKLGVQGVGDTVEINGRRARIVGLTRGIRSFTTSPYVFTSFKNSQSYLGVDERETLFLLIRLTPQANPGTVKDALLQRLPGVEVFTNEEMRRKTQNYWVFSTGAGVTTLMGAMLGLIVGVVVVAQTIYSATVDHLREFGTLKAMGARNRQIYTVILTQATLSALMGYSVAIVIGTVVSRLSERGNAPVELPPQVAVGALLLSVLMCMAASILSIRKATRIDPAMVFRG